MVLNNYTDNAKSAYLNKLVAKLGITFNEDSRNHVTGSDYDMGAIAIPTGKVPYLKILTGSISKRSYL